MNDMWAAVVALSESPLLRFLATVGVLTALGVWVLEARHRR